MKIEQREFASLEEAFAQLGVSAPAYEKPRREQARDYRQAQNKKRVARRSSAKKSRIAILDFETDPFNNTTRDLVYPFLAVLYAPEIETVVIWDEDPISFVNEVVAAIEDLPGKYTVYAHNGGKFDFMFLVSKLRGKVSFKGRGIMTAQIGEHQLRDSYHLIPEKLAALQKQKFDYEKNLTKKNRSKYRKEIIEYCISDCENLYFYLQRFIDRFGFKISVGAAALAKLREHYEIDRVTETTDEYLRRYFFGGRVECLTGRAHYKHPQRLYDLNSAYPAAMANERHPIGNEYIKRAGMPNSYTCFITLECENRGALMARDENNEVSTSVRSGRFFTTIHEYHAAIELGLISDIKIIECVDNMRWTNFEKFVTPLYTRRAGNKELLDTLLKGSVEWNECNTEVVFDKLVMNNAYGKTAQDPRRFKEHYITDPGQRPEREKGDLSPYDWELEFRSSEYWIWKRQSNNNKFLNVGTGASITGAVRAVLMRAIANAVNPVYCDTDSIICDELPNTELHHLKLGAWDLEKEIEELYICGKKLYAYKAKGMEKPFIKAKGAPSQGDYAVTWEKMIDLYGGENVLTVNFGPTLTRRGDQSYIERQIRATAKTVPERNATCAS